MLPQDKTSKSMHRRNNRGHMISEFGAAMMVFVCFFLAPLIDIGFIPVRYLLCQGAITELTHRLSLAETRSEAYTLLTGDSWWKNFLSTCGVTVHDPKMTLMVCGQDPSQTTSVGQGQTLAAEWLPNGSKGPCVYSLQLNVACDLPPLFNVDAGLPGFSAPITMNLTSRSQWENLGLDPQTGGFYLNE